MLKCRRLSGQGIQSECISGKAKGKDLYEGLRVHRMAILERILRNRYQCKKLNSFCSGYGLLEKTCESCIEPMGSINHGFKLVTMYSFCYLT